MTDSLRRLASDCAGLSRHGSAPHRQMKTEPQNVFLERRSKTSESSPPQRDAAAAACPASSRKHLASSQSWMGPDPPDEWVRLKRKGIWLMDTCSLEHTGGGIAGLCACGPTIRVLC